MSLEDENFALKFELDALADLTIRNEAERWVPGFMWKEIDVEHHSRYELACSYVEGKKVLDLACGSGYGSFLLLTKGNASEVEACDLDANAIRYGNIRYPHRNITRLVGNAEEFVKPECYDVVTSFETIEHLINYNQFLNNIHQSLKNKGRFIISTPIVQKTRTSCNNPFHKIEWSFNDFQELIQQQFDIEKIFVQSIKEFEKQNSFALRAFRKAKRIIFSYQQKIKPVDPLPQLYTNQYEPFKITEGYQILVCRKNT